MNNFKHIISRDESELIKNICLAQQENRTRRNFVKLVMKYLKYIEVIFEEAMSKEMTMNKLKNTCARCRV